jgi:hypothetical protein
MEKQKNWQSSRSVTCNSIPDNYPELKVLKSVEKGISIHEYNS